MREWLEKFKPNPWLSRKLLLAAVLLGVGTGAFCSGTPPRQCQGYQRQRQPRAGQRRTARTAPASSLLTTISRSTARSSANSSSLASAPSEVQFLVDRKIVEAECRKYNITVTDADVDYRFRHELMAFGNKGVPMLEKDFVNQILGRFHKTLYEWKEDVIRPKLMMERLVRATIRITSEDVARASRSLRPQSRMPHDRAGKGSSQGGRILGPGPHEQGRIHERGEKSIPSELEGVGRIGAGDSQAFRRQGYRGGCLSVEGRGDQHADQVG